MKGRLRLVLTLLCAVILLSIYFHFKNNPQWLYEVGIADSDDLPSTKPDVSTEEAAEGEIVFNFSEEEVAATLAAITPVGSGLDKIKVDCTEDSRIIAEFVLSRKAYNDILKTMQSIAAPNIMTLVKAIGSVMDSIPIYIEATASLDEKQELKVQINQFTFCFVPISKKYYPELESTITREVNSYLKKSKLRLSQFYINNKGLHLKIANK